MANALEKWLEGRRFGSPFRDLGRFEESFERMLNEFMASRKGELEGDFSFSPSCEIAEEGNSYVMKFDLPGVAKEQIKVQADQDRLTISAERREEKKREDQKKHLSEIYYGAYTRSFTLPGPVDEKKIDAKFENGVLTVTVPKSESSQVKQIPIH